MEAVVHSAMLAASRPAAGKASGVVQSANQAAPRKSLSMGALRAQQQRSRVTDQDRTDDGGESEPLMASQDHGDAEEIRGEEKIREDNIGKEDKPRLRKEFKTEYKKKFRPFSQYEYVEGRFLKRREEEAVEPAGQTEPAGQPGQPGQQPWYAEVIELRKKAGEYKHRGWGTELVPEHISELYSKQLLLWEQVSRRSSLSALSLAAVATPRSDRSPRSISKEEKEKENSRRTSPTKPAGGSLGRQRPHTAQPKLAGVHERSKSEKARKSEKTDDNKKEGAPRTSRKEFPLRHHLERTTGAEDGALLLSPTREKLEPVLPRRKEDPSASPKRAPGLGQTGRSQSLGPAATAPETRSPKRSPRAPSSATATKPAQVNGSSGSAPEPQRRPRPTTLNTTAPSRSKNRTSAPSKGEQQVPVNKSQPSAGRAASSSKGDDQKAAPPKARARPVSGEAEQGAKPGDGEEPEETEELDLEPIVKSPPEPTRVKSPEQIIMRSPEPVNWTVPLDTGKTFTVTQNVPDGERPQGTPSPAPPSATSKGPEKEAPKPAPRKPDPSATTRAVTSTPAASPPITTVKAEPRTTTVKSDPMTTSTFGSLGDSAKPPVTSSPSRAEKVASPKPVNKSEPKSDPMTSSTMGSYSGSSIPKTDSMSTSIMGSSLGESSLKTDPMTASTTGSTAGSSLKSDPMAMSISGSSLGGSSLKSDPMAASMMGSSFGGASLKSDPMASSMMGSSMSSSFAPPDPMVSSMMGSSIGSSNASSTKDPMTTSMMGSLGPTSKSDPMTSSIIGSINGMDTSASKTSGASGGGSSKSGTLTCLEDPSFVFDGSKSSSSTLPPSQAGQDKGYKPQEAPRVQVPPASGGYRVLEAPTPPPAQNPSQPPLSSDALDSARDRFDKFWGKEKEGQQ